MMTKIQQTISDFEMLKPCEKVLVGLSGGADSVALLLSLIELGYEVSACHINHQLRAEESDRDELFCIELCNQLNVILFVEKLDVMTFCKENKLGIEEGARNLRYQTFEKYCGISKIATAHTLSDSLETTLLNLTRGTALKGLCGIPPVRGNIIRPLINCTRQDVEEYLTLKNQGFVTDSTNLSCDYTRNKIRLEVIPKLMEINPALYKNFSRTKISISDDNLYLEKKASDVLISATCGENEFIALKLLAEDYAISSRCIAFILKNSELECNNERVNDIYSILKNGGKINLAKDVYAISKQGKLIIQNIFKNKMDVFCEVLNTDKEYLFSNKIIKFNVLNINLYQKNKNINKMFANNILDYDKIQGNAVVRNRINGDKIKFANKLHTTTIKKLFNSEIPPDMRDEIIFIADEVGAIFVEGYGISERVSLDHNTTNVMAINIVKKDEQNG